VDFENTFTVKAPIDEVYEALLDLERVAPAMPGAKVLEKSGDDSYKVSIKVKLGPVSMTYRGEVKIVEKDPEAHSAVLDVKAKEARGQGTATAKVVLSLVEEDGHARGTMKAHVQLAGKAAAMGRGVIEDVSARLVSTFANNLGEILETHEPGGTAEESAAPAEKAADGKEPSGEEPAAAPKAAAAKPAPAPSAASDDDGLPVGPLVAGMVADRMRDPRVLTGVLGGALALGYLLGRHSR
jgi:carbon monoxide dehydrogenase subunit G